MIKLFPIFLFLFLQVDNQLRYEPPPIPLVKIVHEVNKLGLTQSSIDEQGFRYAVASQHFLDNNILVSPKITKIEKTDKMVVVLGEITVPRYSPDHYRTRSDWAEIKVKNNLINALREHQAIELAKYQTQHSSWDSTATVDGIDYFLLQRQQKHDMVGIYDELMAIFEKADKRQRDAEMIIVKFNIVSVSGGVVDYGELLACEQPYIAGRVVGYSVDVDDLVIGNAWHFDKIVIEVHANTEDEWVVPWSNNVSE